MSDEMSIIRAYFEKYLDYIHNCNKNKIYTTITFDEFLKNLTTAEAIEIKMKYDNLMLSKYFL